MPEYAGGHPVAAGNLEGAAVRLASRLERFDVCTEPRPQHPALPVQRQCRNLGSKWSGPAISSQTFYCLSPGMNTRTVSRPAAFAAYIAASALRSRGSASNPGLLQIGVLLISVSKVTVRIASNGAALGR